MYYLKRKEVMKRWEGFIAHDKHHRGTYGVTYTFGIAVNVFLNIIQTIWDTYWKYNHYTISMGYFLEAYKCFDSEYVIYKY